MAMRIINYIGITIVSLLLWAIIISLATRVMHAQALPDAPTPHILSADHIALAYDAVGRLVLDPWSTNRALGRGGYETELPPPIANHPAMMVTYGAAVLAAEWLGAHELRKHGHPKLARMIFAVDGSMDMYASVNNFRIQRAAAVARMAAPITPVAAMSLGAPVVGTPIVKVPRR